MEDLLSGPRRLTTDLLGRITGVAGPDWAERYAYDPAGNVTDATWPAPPGPFEPWAGSGVQGPRHYAGTLITRAGDIRYEHDACGRIILRQRTRDSRKPDAWRYLYDPLGRRIAKQRLDTNGQVAEHTDSVWDGAVLAEQSATSADTTGRLVTTWDYMVGTFKPVTQSTRQDEVDSQFYTIVTDLIGSPSELVAPDGRLAGYQQHTLWGTTIWHPGGATTPLRFPGQYADDETGLHYNCQRYYDPVTGSYLTPDPLGLAPAPNPHAYVPNPTILTDPLGLSPYNLSDPNPVPRVVNNEYEKIQAMRAAQRTGVPSPLGDPTPRWDYNQLQQGNYVQETYQATGLGPINAAQWRGSLIWDVPGTPYRILERPDGRFGYISDHNYNAPKLFPAPWYPDGGKP